MPARPWRIAESLLQLRRQINEAYPGRDRTSDGGIGDAAHASRSSDHNPWVDDPHGNGGVVTAIDIDEDLSNTVHSIQGVVDAIAASGDPRVKYIIYERRITVMGSRLRSWKKYVGINPHEHHAHISVFPDPALYDSTLPWIISPLSVQALPNDASMAGKIEYIVAPGDTLVGLARKYETSVDQIMLRNGLTNADFIQVGQKLRIN